MCKGGRGVNGSDFIEFYIYHIFFYHISSGFGGEGLATVAQSCVNIANQDSNLKRGRLGPKKKWRIR
jgi:hypothetical protein